MYLRIVCALVLVGTMPMVANAAAARVRHAATAASIKDCTRFNGKHGYYGNPWCTTAEQLQWDRWDSRRSRRTGVN